MTYIDAPTILIDGIHYDRRQFITDIRQACARFQPIIRKTTKKILDDVPDDARSVSLALHAITISLIMCAAREEIARAVIDEDKEPPTRETFAELAGDLFDDVMR